MIKKGGGEPKWKRKEILKRLLKREPKRRRGIQKERQTHE